MKTYLKHLFVLSLAAVLVLAGQGCKKNERTQAGPVLIDSSTVQTSYMVEEHYWRKVSHAPPYGPDTGAVISDSVTGTYTILVTGIGDSVTIDGDKYKRLENAAPDSVVYFAQMYFQQAYFYKNRDSLYYYQYLTYSGHSYSATAVFYYGHKIY